MDGPSRRAGAESPEGVNFLTALLVRYPEIGSARLSQGGRTLTLDFYLHRRLKKTEFREFEEHLQLSWEVFFGLQRVRPEQSVLLRTDSRRGSFERSTEEGSQEVDSLQVVRDIESVTVEELSLLATMMAERFGRDLAINEELHEEDEEYHDDVIHRSLEQVRNLPQEVELTGFRDDMRVLIYASENSGEPA